MRSMFALSAAVLALATAAPALAQSEDDARAFEGFYVGGSFGGAFQSNDGANSNSTVLFDRNLDGRFGDTVTTVAGANAFGPSAGPNQGGFCGGLANGNNLGAACSGDVDGLEYYGRVGYDTYLGGLVVGIMAEGGRPEIRDSVTAFSTTPAFYSFTRELDYTGSIRGRVGYAAGGKTLFYATGGVTYGRVKNFFTTSNGVNSFTQSGKRDAWGASVGGGVEQMIGNNFTLGFEYLYTDIEDDDARVRVGPGVAPATNPFLLGSAAGTDFRRGDDQFRWHSFRVVGTFRF